jgi:Zn-dependent peptidase ImmA (M78 family)
VRERYHQLFGAARPPVPVHAIAEDLLGLRVEEQELSGLSGLLIPASRRVVVNATDTAARRRFTVAHEVGHWVCQCLEGRARPVFCRREDIDGAADRALEREANVFAAELLMPEEAIRSAWADDVVRIASQFAVSTQAMHWRLFSFGLLPNKPTYE